MQSYEKKLRSTFLFRLPPPFQCLKSNELVKTELAYVEMALCTRLSHFYLHYILLLRVITLFTENLENVTARTIISDLIN
jgi:hypothetical protein